MDPFRVSTSVHGVTYDGQNVWFAAGDKLNAFDPASGKTLRSIDVAAHAGTAFDGQHLFQLAEDRIQKIDPKTGRVLATIPAPGGGGDSGLTWAEGTLWVGQYRDRKIHQVDPETGAILRTIESNRFVTGVTWIDGELWHGTWEGDESELRRVDPRTGEVLESARDAARSGRVGARVRWRRSVLLRRRREREGEDRPPAQARLRARQRLREPRRLHAHVIEAAPVGCVNGATADSVPVATAGSSATLVREGRAERLETRGRRARASRGRTELGGVRDREPHHRRRGAPPPSLYRTKRRGRPRLGRWQHGVRRGWPASRCRWR